jgi:membrane protein
MVALIFFQVTAVIMILGAELNRGIMEIKRLRNGDTSSFE